MIKESRERIKRWRVYRGDLVLLCSVSLKQDPEQASVFIYHYLSHSLRWIRLLALTLQILLSLSPSSLCRDIHLESGFLMLQLLQNSLQLVVSVSDLIL